MNKYDIVVIIPSYFPGPVVQNVINTVDLGLTKYFPDKKNLIVIVDSSDLHTKNLIISSCKDIVNNSNCIFSSKRITKGSAIFKGFLVAARCSAKAVLMVDSDLKSISPEWINIFLKPIIDQRVDFVGPKYIRDKYDSLITNHIIYPFFEAKLKCKLRQPIGGEFAFSEKLLNFYMQKKSFHDEVYRFGIDVWLSFTAVVNNFKISQVYLGTKNHGVTIKNPTRPEESLGTMFLEVTKTLFDLLVYYEKNCEKILSEINVVEPNKPINKKPVPVLADFDNLWSTFLRLYPKYSSDYTEILGSKLKRQIENIYSYKVENKSFNVKLWAIILNQYLEYYKKAKTESAKKQIIHSLLPLYFGRIACYVLEVEKLEPVEVEKKIQSDVIIFGKEVSLGFNDHV